MKQRSPKLKLVIAWAVSCWIIPAIADAPLMPTKILPVYQTECAACHMTYPPAMLSKSSWQKIMIGLDKHYGTDASLDEVTRAQISVWLQTHGGTYKRVELSSPGERLTTTQWFEKKHKKIEKEVWKRQSIKSKAHCQACHKGADIGDFEDDRVRIPL